MCVWILCCVLIGVCVLVLVFCFIFYDLVLLFYGCGFCIVMWCELVVGLWFSLFVC